MKKIKRISFFAPDQSIALHAIVMVGVNHSFSSVGTLTKMSCEQIISSSIGEEKGMIVAFGPCGFANYVLKRKKERKRRHSPPRPLPPPSSC